MIFEAMIVDDEAPARVELINQLERTGRVHVVSEAVCLQEGIAKLRRGGVDVVFVDHNIAGAGTTMLPDVLPELPKVPIFIYMTAYSDVMDDPFGMEPLGFLVKPVEDGRLDEIVSLIEDTYWRGLEAQRAAAHEAAASAADAAPAEAAAHAAPAAHAAHAAPAAEGEASAR